MSEELKSLLTLIFPIVIFLVLCIILAIKESVKYNLSFKDEFFNSFADGFSIFTYIYSLYLLYLLHEHLEADNVMKYGLLVFVGLLWLILILNYTSDENKGKRIKSYKEKVEEDFGNENERLKSLREESEKLVGELDNLETLCKDAQDELLEVSIKCDYPNDFGIKESSNEYCKLLKINIELSETVAAYNKQINKLNIKLAINEEKQKNCIAKLHIYDDIKSEL